LRAWSNTFGWSRLELIEASCKAPRPWLEQLDHHLVLAALR